MLRAGMREVGNQSRSEGVGNDRHDDGYGRGGSQGGAGRDRYISHDDIHLALNQLGSQLRYTVVIAVGRSPVDHHIASLGVARVP